MHLTRKKATILTIFSVITSIFVMVLLLAPTVFFPTQYPESQIPDRWVKGTIMSDATVPEYFNDRSWASIFGLDDCSNTTDAIEYYSAIGINDVPTVAYLYNYDGSPSVVMASGSELALHYPHDWQTSAKVDSIDSVTIAKEGKDFISKITAASKWGTNVISMANPGDEATIPLLAALYEITGIRIDGMANHITELGTDNGTPARPFDLMNMQREINCDNDIPLSELLNITDKIAATHGVLSIYGHQWTKCDIPGFIQYLNTTDQWKTNDGELASYIFERNSLNITGFEGSYTVSKTDPLPYGYWNVPVTISIPLGAYRTDIMMDGTPIAPLASNGLSCGYSIQGDRVLITEYWNQTTQIEVN